MEGSCHRQLPKRPRSYGSCHHRNPKWPRRQGSSARHREPRCRAVPVPAHDFLLAHGGHIGYDVRPTARRRGHATAMLRAALPRARVLGLDRVLITCDATNTASRKVIEACGGLFEDRRGVKLRFWVTTGEVSRVP
ncbi:GNAT family N-acetyltransferase [Streptomyces benahoarensis]|uniref:GNAT family N-acetyltransferase n=1 Tax=Streptomyces benahoarensis TaxID=2595054 RepID=A0A553ZDP9_9ACTN|nr:GNAT family N-acetyltransferase [Streptomyces benahoarensis]TSB39539.1 GNAT family N-acetyltransferase [Streptomyces benahoarensis]